MAYSSGGDIEAIDYNNLAWGSDSGGTYTTNSSNKNIAVVWGTGNGRFGYGQSTTSITQAGTGPNGSLTSVDGPSAGDVTADDVTAQQWNGLILTLNKSLYHQGGSNLTALSGVTVGSDITYYSVISTGVTTAWNNADTGSVGARVGGAGTTGTVSGTWQTSASFAFTVTFTSSDAARYFFNAGGQLRITNAGPPSGSGRSADWRTLCTNVGTLTLGYRNTTKAGGTPSSTVTGTNDILLDDNNGGFWNLTGTAVNHFRQYSLTSAYTQNYLNMSARVSGTAGSNGGLGDTVTITVTHQDDDTNSFQQTVATGSTSTLEVFYPNSGVLANTWGAVSVSVTVTTT
jgi:hypothetical protein